MIIDVPVFLFFFFCSFFLALAARVFRILFTVEFLFAVNSSVFGSRLKCGVALRILSQR